MMISILEASDTGLLDDDQYTGGSDTGLLDDDQYTGGFRHWITG